jgi:hypothetical protein
MNPVLSHALEGIILEIVRLDQLLKVLSGLDTRRSFSVLKNAREKLRQVSDSFRAHLQAEAHDTLSVQTLCAPPETKRQRTLDAVVVFKKEDANPDATH